VCDVVEADSAGSPVDRGGMQEGLVSLVTVWQKVSAGR
jgi:hypothetical protein